MSVSNIIREWLENPEETLDLSSQGLEEWPSLLKGKNKLIQRIDMFDNKLKAIPTLPNLVEADFSENEITKLGKIPNCIILRVYNNKLKSLPTILTKLVELDVSGNMLSRLPAKMPNLEIMDVRNNKIKVINPKNYPKIEVALYMGNPLKRIPKFGPEVQIIKEQVEVPAEEEEIEVEEIPVEEIEIEVEEIPAEEIPTEEIPVEEIPAEEIEMEVEKIPTEEIPAEEIEIEVEEILAEEIPAEEIEVETELKKELLIPRSPTPKREPVTKILTPMLEEEFEVDIPSNLTDVVMSEVKYTDIQTKKVKKIVQKRSEGAKNIWSLIPNYPGVSIIPLPPIRKYKPEKPKANKDSVLGKLGLGEAYQVEKEAQESVLSEKEKENILSEFQIKRVPPRRIKRGQKAPEGGYYSTVELKTFTKAAGLSVSDNRQLLASALIEWYSE